MIGVTFGVGRWRQTAELAAAAARKHTGLKTVVLADDEWARVGGRYPTPQYLKLHLFELVDDDQIFYFDADAIHLNDWNPREFACRGALVAALDPFIGQLAEESGVPADRYFNAGVMILNRACHEPMLRVAQTLAGREIPWVLHDQTCLNKARQLCGLELECLPAKFNHLRFYDDPNFDPDHTVIAHWTPHRNEDIDSIEAACQSGTVLTIRNAASVADKFIRQIPDLPKSNYAGRGIAICAGGAKYLPSAWVLIRILRRLGCKLPIQVWYRGEEECDESWMELVEPYGVECVDAYAVRDKHPHLHLGGWELKPYAVLHSPFQEVMLLDADNVPVRDPEYLFDAPEYRETGALFWPDGCRMIPSDPCWQAFGAEYRDERNFESGQMLIDKAHCWRALNLCNWYNEHSHFYYRVVYGDKDTFRFAWHRLGQRFATPDRDMGNLSHTLLQYDPAGELIFQHRFADKWRLAGNHRVPGFQHEEACNAFMAELRQRWNILRHITEKLPAADRRQIAELAEARFVLIRPGYNRWPIQLSPSGYVGAGWTAELFLWWVEHGELVLAGDDGRPTCRLKQMPSGNWESRSRRDPKMLVRLIPTPSVVVSKSHGLLAVPVS